MAKISTYVIDGTIVDGDKVIGSDANNDMITKNYTIGDLVAYFAVSIGNYLVPYNNATADVDLGTFTISASSLYLTDGIFLNGSPGVSGEALVSQGPGLPAVWAAIVGSQDLLSVLNNGNIGDRSIILEDASGRIVSDIGGIHSASANVYVKNKSTNDVGQFFSNKVTLQEATLQREVSYSSNEIEYTDTIFGNTVTVRPGAFNNQTFIYPNVGGAFVMSVNGIFADLSGNVTIPVGPGGATTWGSITGTLSNQTDLQSALNAKQDELNGTGFVKATGTTISYDNSTYLTDAPSDGTTYGRNNGTWTAIPTSSGDAIYHGTASGTDTYTVTIAGPTSYADGDAYLIRFTNGNTTGATLNINGLGAIPLYRNNDGPLLGGDIADGGEMLCIYNSTLVRFQVIGISPNSLIAYVTNDDSVTITKGQAVYAFGGTGDRMTVKLANNTGDATSAQTVGLVLSASIGANQKGFIMMQGLLDGLNILPTSTFNDGDPLYLGATPGSITNVKPYAPAHLVYIGVVTTASNGNAGRLYVRVQNGYELDELHNVQAQSPALKDTLWYDNTVTPKQWKTASISTILGYTPVNPTRNIGTTAPLAGGGDLSADRTLSITQANTSVDGYLSATDWNTFNGKIGSDATLLGYNGLGSTIKGFPLGINLTAVGGSSVFTDSRLWLIPVYVGADGTLTGVKWYQVTIGAYTADNYNGVGLYTISGGTLTLVASSTNDGNIWKAASTTWGSKAFTTPYAATRGTYYIGALINSSTAITGAVGAVAIGAATLTGFDFTASRMYCYLATQLTLPASVTLSSTVSLGTSALYFSLY